MVPIVKDLIYLKIEFPKYDNSIKFETIDHFENIIGGIGLSCLNKNKNARHSLRNCILFNCQQGQILNCLKECKIVVVYDKQKWDQLYPMTTSKSKPKQSMFACVTCFICVMCVVQHVR